MKDLHTNLSVADIDAPSYGAGERDCELEGGAGACCEPTAEHDEPHAAPGSGPGC